MFLGCFSCLLSSTGKLFGRSSEEQEIGAEYETEMEGVSYELDRPLHKHCSTLKLTSPYARTSGDNEHDRIPVINYRDA